jgi:hypothetical protein
MALSKRISDAQLLVVVIFVLSVLDLALLERKFDLFSGGFLLPERVATFSARLMFCAAVVALETGMAGCVWYLLHIVGLMRNTAVGVTRYLFVVLYGGGSVVGLVAKYQILSYFGDFLSLNVLRNLGGGSLAGALNYGSSELLLFAAWLVPGITATWLAFRWMKRRLPAMKRPPWRPMRIPSCGATSRRSPPSPSPAPSSTISAPKNRRSWSATPRRLLPPRPRRRWMSASASARTTWS